MSINPLAQEDLVKYGRIYAVTGDNRPRISDLCRTNKIVAATIHKVYFHTDLCAATGHQLVTMILASGTFVDPHQQGGKLDEVTKRDLIKLVGI